MNIEFQTAGLIISILLLVLYISKSNLQLYSQKIFLHALVMTAVLLLADILSIVAIKWQDHLPTMAVHLICKIYIVFLLFEASIAFLYILYDALGEVRYRKVTKATIILNCVEAAIVMALPIYTYSEGRVAYTYGASTTMVYIFVAVAFANMIVATIRLRKNIYPRRLFAFSIWIAIWIAAAALQFLNSEWLLVSFAAVLGMIILYVSLENPESNINQKMGCFNSFALSQYLRQQFERQEAFYVFSVSMKSTSMDQEDMVQRIVSRMKVFKKTQVFKQQSTDLMVITKNQAEYQRLRAFLNKMIREDERFRENFFVMLLENGLKAGRAKKIEPLFEYYYHRFQSVASEPFVILDDHLVDEYLNQELVQKEIVDALAEDRVEVFFQPIYSNHTNSFVSAEALTRIRKKDGSLLSPGIFIPVAENSGQILELGERIFTKVCQFLHEKKPWEYGLEYIEVNLSVLQCEKENLAETLMSIMQQYEVEPKRINLEITETAGVSAKKKLLKNMDILTAQQCTFSLDDFGKGESNLMYIVEMPVTIVKLDYDITKAYHRNDKAKSVVRLVITMAHEMGLSVVAEGIETKEELDCMTELGIDYIQGYYFSKPLPREEYYAFIQDKNLSK